MPVFLISSRQKNPLLRVKAGLYRHIFCRYSEFLPISVKRRNINASCAFFFDIFAGDPFFYSTVTRKFGSSKNIPLILPFAFSLPKEAP